MKKTAHLATLVMLSWLSVPAFSMEMASAWKIAPKDSEIRFTATQNNAPVDGSFKTFSGDINFDPKHLGSSKIKIQIEISSLSSSNPDVISTLLSADWFNAKKYPHAVFTTNSFKDTGKNTFQAVGNLTIRDKTLPTTVSFVLKEYSQSKAQVVGSTTLKRSAFGVGQGEWASPDVVKDEVKVDFKITALPARS